MTTTESKRIARFFPPAAWAAAPFLLVLVVHLILRVVAERAGVFPISTDESVRVEFASIFARTGDYSTFHYLWLPLPFVLNGTLGLLLSGDFWRATLLSNTAATVLSIWAMMAAVFALVYYGKGRIATRRRMRRASVLAGLTGLAAASAPWTTFLSHMGYAEPLAWAGQSFCILGLVLASLFRGWRAAGAFVLAGLGVAAAAMARYESWLFAPGLLAAGGLLLVLRAINRDSGPDRSSLAEWAGLLAGVIIAFAPILWWLSIHKREWDDMLRPFAWYHRFDIDEAGRARPEATFFAGWKATLHHTFWLPVLALVPLFPRRWTVPYAMLAVPPLLALLAFIVFSTRGGVAWVVPERSLGYFTMVLVFPAALCAADWAAGGTGRSGRLRRNLAALLFFALFAGMNVIFTRTPMVTNFPEVRETRPLVNRALARVPLGRQEKILLPPGDMHQNGWVFVHPRTSRLLTPPGQWGHSLPAAEELLPWLRENKVGLVITRDELRGNETVHELVERSYGPQDAEHALREARRRGDAVVIATQGRVTYDLPAQYMNILLENGLEGPRPGDGWVRYAAILPTPDGQGPAWEARQTDPAAAPDAIHRRWFSRPAGQRESLPGRYRLTIAPNDYYGNTVIEVGRGVFQPLRNGYYVVTFNLETGEPSDYFRIEEGTEYAVRGPAAPLYVYRLQH